MVQRLYAIANADRWALSIDVFRALLSASAERAFAGDAPAPRELERYFRSLHLEDLALACACAEGIESAWDHFVLHYRPVLYRAAAAASHPSAAREVADSLYAELFGLGMREGVRHSHFRYFHGRSSLGTWLRAVLAQRLVDAMRRTARLEPLPADESAHPLASGSPQASNLSRYLAILQRAITAAVGTLAPRDRLRLRAYYAQNLTLAQIGQLLGEHEGTVSRHLTRARRSIRRQVETALREDERMKDEEITECFAAALEDPGPLDLAELLGTAPESALDPGRARKKVASDRSK
jgi:RNA polymerase sigma-70 factor